MANWQDREMRAHVFGALFRQDSPCMLFMVSNRGLWLQRSTQVQVVVRIEGILLFPHELTRLRELTT